MVAPYSYFILAGVWILYFGLHSLLASERVKNKVQPLAGKYFRYYRLFYNIIAVLTLVPILLYNAIVSAGPLVSSSLLLSVLEFGGLAFATYGVILIHLSFKQYSKREFLGITLPQEKHPEPLHKEGILQQVRHPLYAGTILIAIGFWCFSPTLANLITSLAWIIYTLIGIRLEETKLLKLYGDEYQRYREEVPMLVPRLGRRP
uniref:Isoprenylcysteine carboxylmethyltransferase family protein n=1 Tax=Roseihalotalea indica TaxID=2867963 RepID=A0AA49GQU6_9BACT|nr:isoprenylcysteine carboxylmethyltransferase family protein [Tunicatimonas sp. TK19036]